ncbi:hypothetical protein BO78DRAFT_427699 [Aspergillus sclerotiicarbonarius CBS 121057]|uniref:BRCT domain-containing protein n=1 Tax=Aspergillus sclerotiicarbonarius (strain CBS 121057 / IBT 28362) TaxID=1448318 RepID=A0A319FL83_ASPSB|nr:hypothetical protein BO78DRAFT_427699 [Aspergillus sclerotiicarbonarius CBS 121057]
MPPPRTRNLNLNPNPILPQNHLTFDVWNTSSAGHQIADSAQGTAWRDTRREKLMRQFGEGEGDCTLYQSGGGGDGRGQWVVDSSAPYSSRGKTTQERGTKQMDIRGMFGVSKRGGSTQGLEEMAGEGESIRKKMRVDSDFPSTVPGERKIKIGSRGENMRSILGTMSTSGSNSKIQSQSQSQSQKQAQSERDAQAHPHPHAHALIPTSTSTSTATSTSTSTSTSASASTSATSTFTSSPTPTSTHPPTHQRLHTSTSTSTPPPPPISTQPTPISTPQILTNLTIHINGQTTPHISDHKLKHLLITHGADLALHLHRKVTHVIICLPNSGPGKGLGSGGGLAAGKLQKEIQRGGWKGIKIVGVEWVLDSIAAGKRLSETKYAVNLRSNQKSVFGYLTSSSSPSSSSSTAPTPTSSS